MSNAPVGSPCRCGGTFILTYQNTTKCNRCGTFETADVAQERCDLECGNRLATGQKKCRHGRRLPEEMVL